MRAEFVRTPDGMNAAICKEHGLMIEGGRTEVRRLQNHHNYTYHRQSYGFLMRKEWFDPEPDRLSIDLKLNEDLEPFVVFTTSSSWMDKQQVTEIRDYLSLCLEEMENI